MEPPPAGGATPSKSQSPAKTSSLPLDRPSGSIFNNPSSVDQSERLNVDDPRIYAARFVCDISINPKSMCEEYSETFKEMIHTLNPNCPFTFDFDTLQRNCLKIYAQQKAQVKEIFSKFGGRISLSMDLLSAGHSWLSVGYFCLAAHFIDDEWKLRRWVIKYCSQIQSAPSEVILESLKEWGIEGKVLAVIVGGGNTDIFDYIKEDIQDEEGDKIPMNALVFHLLKSSCDIISKMVQEGFKEIKDLITKVKRLAWSRSLPLWYLKIAKLRDALDLEASGEFSSESVRQDFDVPSEDQWAKVRSICRIADKVYEIVEGLFEVKRPTANLYLPYLLEIRAYLIQESANYDDFVRSVAQKMLKTFNEYWEDVHLMLAIAAFMDPRYKMKFIEFSFPKSGEDGDDNSKATSILESIRKLYDGYTIPNEKREYLLSDSSSESDDEEEVEEFDGQEDEKAGSEKHVKKQRRKLVDTLSVLNLYQRSVQSSNDHNHPHKSDLDLYLEEPVLEWTENFNVLLWWKDNCSKYPQLSRMARDFLAIPFSVATSYGAYYTTRREADRTVASVEGDLMNALMCSRSWKLREFLT